MRRLARVLPFALLPLFATTAAPVPPALSGGGTPVTITGSSTFSPGIVSVGLGGMVTWTNDDTMTHTATATGFFDTGSLGTGDSDTVAFQSSGRFGYRCAFHSFMTGAVKVTMKKTVRSRGGFKLRWATAAAPDSWRYDVQVDKPGTGGFVSFRSGASARTASFNPSRSGTYKFRARTHSGARVSGYSPAMTVVIS